MKIDRTAFWTDIASGLVLAAIVPFLPRLIALALLGLVLGLVLLFVLDAASGGSALEQLADMIMELIGSR